MRRTERYALWGALGAVGAPAGWLVVEALRGASPLEVAARDPLLLGYLLVATAIAFAVFGASLGRAADRLDAAAARFEQLSFTDALTELKNPRWFHEELRRERARAERDRTPLALISADIDLFKAINDRFGHPFGDRALVHVARTLQARAREGDVVARVGGEEFAVLCPGATLEEAEGIAERMRAALAATALDHPAGPVPVTASFGVAAAYGADGQDVLVASADEALYRAKREGRNRVSPASRPRSGDVRQ